LEDLLLNKRTAFVFEELHRDYSIIFYKELIRELLFVTCDVIIMNTELFESIDLGQSQNVRKCKLREAKLDGGQGLADCHLLEFLNTEVERLQLVVHRKALNVDVPTYEVLHHLRRLLLLKALICF